MLPLLVVQAYEHILPLLELSKLRIPTWVPPQALAATHEEAIGAFYKN